MEGNSDIEGRGIDTVIRSICKAKQQIVKFRPISRCVQFKIYIETM